jgi:S1-C subfamily serine protease
MKKAIAIIILGLLWCNVGFTKITFSKCSGLDPMYGYKDTWTIDLDRGVIKEITKGQVGYWTITKNYGDTIISTAPSEQEVISSEMMRALILNMDFRLMLDLTNKTISMLWVPKFNAPKKFKKAIKKMIAKGEWKENVKGNCDVENLYAKKENPKKKEPKQSPDDDKVLAAASGTGFFVSRTGHIVTNHHVIDECKVVKVNYTGDEIEAKILARDKTNDLAILQVKITPKKVFSVSNEDVSLLEDIIVAGFPLGKRVSAAIKTHKGNVTALAGFGDNYSNFQTDATINEGNSGGPVMDQKGNVVGVAVALMPVESGQNIFFVVKSSTLKTFANSNGLQFLPPNNQDLSNKVLGQLVSDATVYLECWMTVAKIKELIAREENRKAFFSEYK